MFAVLSGYEEQPFLNASDTAVDFFKDLYTAIMPDKVRHSLGEYYTPPWLADLVVDRSLALRTPNDGWRGIDPCCGSGTFVTTMLKRKLQDTEHLNDKERLAEVLHSVKGIDLNPLAVLTARINYFINISPLLHDDDAIEIPIYLGDASYVPEKVYIGDIPCFQYQIATIASPWPEGHPEAKSGSFINVTIPVSGLADLPRFSEMMSRVEHQIKRLDEASIVNSLMSVCDQADLTPDVVKVLTRLAGQFVTLEKRKWNGIWARIVTDFLTTAALGRFDVVVGNPPWIDWRNLPSSYRNRIKSLCLSRHLFSGDGITGGVNLNVCALITNVAAGNWLSKDGVLAFLMPDSLLVQSTYKGFRELHMPGPMDLNYLELHDWSAGGKPFAPVSQKFYTYFFRGERVRGGPIPLKRYVKKANRRRATPPVLPLTDYKRVSEFKALEHVFEVEDGVADPIGGDPRNGFLLQKSTAAPLPPGISDAGVYTARQGLEFFPKSVFEMKFRRASSDGEATFSKLDNDTDQFLLETDFMYPLIQGARIGKFAAPDTSVYVPFPYDEGERSPIPASAVETQAVDPASTLSIRAPKILDYFSQVEAELARQSAYNDKIVGRHKTEIYTVARVGAYTYGHSFVAFRDNTAWAACVVSEQTTPWGERKRPLFQKHAVTISQRPDGKFISHDEAHFICAVMNSTSVEQFVMASSDHRGFKIRLPFHIPQYDPTKSAHRKLMWISKAAHEIAKHPRFEASRSSLIALACKKADLLYRELLEPRTRDTTPVVLGSIE